MSNRSEPDLDKEMDEPLRGTREDLPLLPELTPLKAMLAIVDYLVDEFQGKINYIKDGNKENILDEAGNPIPRRVFNLTFYFADHELSNGEPRRAWLKLGASTGKKAKLPKLLAALKLKYDDNITPRGIKELLENQRVVLQLKNNQREKDGRIFQNIIFDTIRPLTPMDVDGPG